MKENICLYEETKRALGDRGVKISELAEIILDLQSSHTKNINKDIALENIYGVLKKREIQHAILTGIMLDELIEKGHIDSPIANLIKNDDKLYGVDETLALSITNCYGS